MPLNGLFYPDCMYLAKLGFGRVLDRFTEKGYLVTTSYTGYTNFVSDTNLILPYTHTVTAI